MKNFDQITQHVQAAFENIAGDYTVNEDESINHKKDRLKAQEVAKIVGIYKPSSIGKKKLQALFSYNEADEAVTLEVATEVIQVQLVGEIIQGLPEKVVAFSQHPIELLVKNTNGFDATDIDIDEENLSIETIVEEDSTGAVIAIYSLEDFKIKKRLDPNRQYRIKATYHAAELAGKDQLNILVKYNESKSLAHADERAGLSFKTLPGGSTLVISQEEARVVIDGKVRPETLRLKLNQEHKVEFIFTNKSPDYPATGIHIALTEKII